MRESERYTERHTYIDRPRQWQADAEMHMHTLRERDVQTATGSSSYLQTESYTGYLLQTETVKERGRQLQTERETDRDMQKQIQMQSYIQLETQSQRDA